MHKMNDRARLVDPYVDTQTTYTESHLYLESLQWQARKTREPTKGYSASSSEFEPRGYIHLKTILSARLGAMGYYISSVSPWVRPAYVCASGEGQLRRGLGGYPAQDSEAGHGGR